MSAPKDKPDADLHRRLAAQLFNDTWVLLDKPDRTADEDVRMIHTAHASRWHWEQVGTPLNLLIGEWQCSRVYATLKRGEPAIFHARRCLGLAQRNSISGFHLATAHEAMARALTLLKEPAAAEHLRTARDLLKVVTNKEERRTLEQDLASIAPSRGRGTTSASRSRRPRSASAR